MPQIAKFMCSISSFFRTGTFRPSHPCFLSLQLPDHGDHDVLH